MGVQGYPRRIPDPVLTPLEANGSRYRRTFRLTLDFWGQGSSYQEERKLLPMDGFGRGLHHEYLELAQQRTAEFLRCNNLHVSTDQTTVAGVSMIVFYRPSDPPLPPAGWTRQADVYSQRQGDLHLQVAVCADPQAPTVFAGTLWRGDEILCVSNELALTLAMSPIVQAAQQVRSLIAS